MEKWKKELLEKLKKERPSYREMIEYCCDSCILNNCIVEELAKKDIFFDVYTGSLRTFYNVDGEEISEEEFYEQEDQGAYEEEDYIYQFGTPWSGVPADWKEPEEDEEEKKWYYYCV